MLLFEGVQEVVGVLLADVLHSKVCDATDRVCIRWGGNHEVLVALRVSCLQVCLPVAGHTCLFHVDVYVPILCFV
jgi:hypothetical protein